MSQPLLSREIAKITSPDPTDGGTLKQFSVRTGQKVNLHAPYHVAVYQYDGAQMHEIARWTGKDSRGMPLPDSDLLTQALDEIKHYHPQHTFNVQQSRFFDQ